MGSGVAVLRSPPFRALFLGSTVSRLGSAVAPVALAFAVLDLRNSATALGVVVGARSIANVALLLYGGVLADRLPRGVVLVGSSVAAALSQGALAGVVAAGIPDLWLLAALSAVNGAAAAFALPASAALIPQTVDAGQLTAANAVSRLGANAAAVLGVSFAGLLVATLGSAWGIAVDAVTYLLAAVFFARIRIAAVPRTERTSVLADLTAGWHGFRTRQWLWVVVAAFTVINAVEVGVVAVLGPVFADRGVGRTWWGLALAAQTVGFVLGGLFALRLRLQRLLRFGVLCMLPLALPMIVMAADGGVVPLLVAFLLAGLGLEQFGVAWQTTMQEHVPADLLARVNSYDLLGSYIAIPIGEIAAGPVAGVAGLSTTFAWAAGVVVVATGAMLLSPQVRRLRSLTAQPATDP